MVMKKLFFSLVLAFMALMNVDAQDVQLATLQKTDGLQVFYGADAFKEAMEAADNGDVITLTAGSFNATTITKAVSIYGAGYEMDAKMGNSETGETIDELPKYPTRLVGDFNIAINLVNEQPVEGLYMEGIYSDNSIMVGSKLVAASFVKCRFQNFAFWKDTNTMIESKNCSFSQCRIAYWFEPGNSQQMVLTNCIVNLLGRNPNVSSMYIKNTIIYALMAQWRGIIKDSIVLGVRDCDTSFHSVGAGTVAMHSDCSVYHTLFYPKVALNNVVTKDGNWLLENKELTTLLFGTYMEIYTEKSTYELTDEAKTTYLGTDGKEIGLYGGANPFSPILTIPRVVKKDIAAQTADGKLKVNIKVETGDSSF